MPRARADGGVSISSVFATDNITLGVILTAGPNGSAGGGVSVNYGDALPSLSVVDFQSLDTPPYFTLHAGDTTDRPPYIDNINSAGFWVTNFGIGLPAGMSAYLGTVTFHEDFALNGIFEISVGTDGPGGTDALLDIDGRNISATTTLNSAFIYFLTDYCAIDKKCSVGGSAPEDACSAAAGEEVTYLYDFVGGTALIFDDKLGAIGEWRGETLTRTTILTGTTTNTAYFQEIDAVCLNGIFSDSVTVTVATPTPTPTATPTATPTPAASPPPRCEDLWPVDSLVTIAKGQSQANNLKVSHLITGNIVDPDALCPASGPCTAHRIPVCAGTEVRTAITGSIDNRNVGKGTLSCDPAGCQVGAIEVTEKYRSISHDGRDADRITLLPQ